MAELDKISRVQSLFSPHFLLIILIYLVRALATLCKLGGPSGCKGLVQRTGKYCCIRHMEYKPEYLSNGLPSTQLAGATYTSRTAESWEKKINPQSLESISASLCEHWQKICWNQNWLKNFQNQNSRKTANSRRDLAKLVELFVFPFMGLEVPQEGTRNTNFIY